VSNLKDAEKYGKHVIISSEPTTYDEKQWDLVPKNHCVMVGRDMKPVTKPLNINWEEL
jgi:glutamine amidotransferase